MWRITVCIPLTASKNAGVFNVSVAFQKCRQNLVFSEISVLSNSKALTSVFLKSISFIFGLSFGKGIY